MAKVSSTTPLEDLTSYLDGLLTHAIIVPEDGQIGNAQKPLWARKDKANSIWGMPAQVFPSGDDGTHYYLATIAQGLPTLAIFGFNKISQTANNKTTTRDQSFLYAFITFAGKENLDEVMDDLRKLKSAVINAEGDDILNSYK